MQVPAQVGRQVAGWQWHVESQITQQVAADKDGKDLAEHVRKRAFGRGAFTQALPPKAEGRDDQGRGQKAESGHVHTYGHVPGCAGQDIVEKRLMEAFQQVVQAPVQK